MHTDTIEALLKAGLSCIDLREPPLGCWRMPRTWVWMQIAIVVFVVIGMIVAITKLA